LPGLTGQSSTHGRCFLDRPVEPAMTAKCVREPKCLSEKILNLMN
jgi:hypothetical protein